MLFPTIRLAFVIYSKHRSLEAQFLRLLPPSVALVLFFHTWELHSHRVLYAKFIYDSHNYGFIWWCHICKLVLQQFLDCSVGLHCKIMFNNLRKLFLCILHFCVTCTHNYTARSKHSYKCCEQLRFVQWHRRNMTTLLPSIQTVSVDALLIMYFSLRFKWAILQ